MVKSINSNPTYRARNKYYGHDLSQRLEFTSSTGHLLPVYYDVLNPGEKVSVKTYMKTRTMPLASAAMVKMNEYLEWYFVPINQIYKPFGNWFFGIQDFDSSIFMKPGDPSSTRIGLKFPYINSLGIRDFSRELIGSGQTTMMGEEFYNAFVRLASHLGIDDTILLDNVEQNNGVYWSITPLLFAAYQKIWMDHYRLSDRYDNDPRSYNLDKYYDRVDSIDGQSSLDVADLKRMFELRYRPLQKDFYTNNFPSPLFGSGSIGSQQFATTTSSGGLRSTLESVNQWLTDVMRVYPIGADGNDQTVAPTSTALGYDAGDGVNVAELKAHQMTQANIRALFAADKLLEITRRSGKHYDAQTLAHFGVEVPDNIEGQSYYLGRSVQELVVGDVVSTAQTDGAPLGEIAGKGYSAGGSDTIRFEAPCHGVLMCLYSSAPVVDYIQEGLDKLNCLIDKTDYFVPEYDNLGMQPLFGYQCKVAANSIDNSRIRGWQYRYMEFKQKFNRVIAGLKHTQRHWTVAKRSRDVGYAVSDYYTSPDALGDVMLYPYNFGFNGDSSLETSSAIFESDPLLHEIAFDVKKASQMTMFGLMEL